MVGSQKEEGMGTIAKQSVDTYRSLRMRRRRIWAAKRSWGLP